MVDGGLPHLWNIAVSAVSWEGDPIAFRKKGMSSRKRAELKSEAQEGVREGEVSNLARQPQLTRTEICTAWKHEPNDDWN